ASRPRARSLALLGGRTLAEVCGRNAEVRSDLVRRPLRECRPLIEHMDSLADLEHQRDVVVDEQNTGAAIANGADRGGESRYLRLGQTRRGLVHEHEPR